jgi:pyruvate dehydrogenase E1 component beta subunit
MTRTLKFHQAILEATEQLLDIDPRVYVIGLGAPDPKGLFGTTMGLEKKYGSNRIMDMPVSENGMTGVLIGSALVGMRPIMTHQRVDFSLLALDQLINNAAKWHYMFGGKASVPIVIRMFIGRGWGQGPQHSQTLHSLFAHIPGLKVVMPSTCFDAKGLLISAVQDPNPVIFIEHRWLHNISGEVPQEMYTVPIGKAKLLREGDAITIVASSHMSLEAWRASALLEGEGISAEIIDLRTIRPIDAETILQSVRKTGRLLVVDPDWKTCGFAAEILALVAEEAMGDLKVPPARLTYPDHPCPTSWTLANHYYPASKEIAVKVLQMMGKKSRADELWAEVLEMRSSKPLDVPDPTFTGPF